jgi:hypothetical protein
MARVVFFVQLSIASPAPRRDASLTHWQIGRRLTGRKKEIAGIAMGQIREVRTFRHHRHQDDRGLSLFIAGV